jgi:GlpG protein
MRQIGTIEDQAHAQRLADYLLTLGITTRLDSAPTGTLVWVHREDSVDRARSEFAAFKAAPDDPKYTSAGTAAQEIRKQIERSQKEHLKNTIDVRSVWADTRGLRRIPLTYGLIAISILVTFLISFGGSGLRTGNGKGSLVQPEKLQEKLYYAQPHVVQGGEEVSSDPWTLVNGRISSNALDDLRAGEIWRPITPIFLHYSGFHLLFNMLWLFDIGGMFERRRGTLRFALFVLAAALVSNTAQYLYAKSPLFGGMSGVDMALFGYVWMKGLYEPESGMGLSRRTTTFVLLYLAITMTGNVTNIAHAAHFAGVVFGVLVALAPHLVPTVQSEDDVE